MHTYTQARRRPVGVHDRIGNSSDSCAYTDSSSHIKIGGNTDDS